MRQRLLEPPRFGVLHTAERVERLTQAHQEGEPRRRGEQSPEVSVDTLGVADAHLSGWILCCER
jgi:hypothetical protein